MDRPVEAKENEKDGPRRMLTSCEYRDYPRVDLCIYSSFGQPYFSFNRDTNSFYHRDIGAGSVEPEESETRPPRILVYFIPGNPGLTEFYDEFLPQLCQSLHHLGGCEAISSGHLGHSLRHNSNLDLRFFNHWLFWNQNNASVVGGAHLSDQIDYHSHLVQKLLDHPSYHSSKTKLVVMGHSVGAYIATKILEKYSDRVMHIVGLFPTISHIARSKNGRVMWPLFSPITLPFINVIQIIVSTILPKVVIIYLITLLFHPNGSSTTSHKKRDGKICDGRDQSERKKEELSQETCLLLVNFILNINSVSSVLKMARSEMQTICQLDADFIRKFHAQISLIWTSPNGDEWIDEREIDEIIQIFDSIQSPSLSPKLTTNNDNQVSSASPPFTDQKNSNASRSYNRRFLSGVPSWKRMQQGVPHAFCLNHSEIMAKECSQLIENKILNL